MSRVADRHDASTRTTRATGTARLLLALALMALPLASPGSTADHCTERERLDDIMNVEPGAHSGTPGVGAAGHDPVLRLYDIVDIWAVFVALGDYENAALMSKAVMPRLVELFESVSKESEAAHAEDRYARLLIAATLAKVSLIGHRWFDAIRYGEIARDEARRLAELDGGEPRARFFLGLYEYYVGVAPIWLRGIGQLVGVDGDPRRGTELLEEAVRADIALAPEAARVLLEEVRGEHRPRCRYLPLAQDLARQYPRNSRFKWYVERERESCGDRTALAVADPPRLLAGCSPAR